MGCGDFFFFPFRDSRELRFQAPPILTGAVILANSLTEAKASVSSTAKWGECCLVMQEMHGVSGRVRRMVVAAVAAAAAAATMVVAVVFTLPGGGVHAFPENSPPLRKPNLQNGEAAWALSELQQRTQSTPDRLRCSYILFVAFLTDV